MISKYIIIIFLVTNVYVYHQNYYMSKCNEIHHQYHSCNKRYISFRFEQFLKSSFFREVISFKMDIIKNSLFSILKEPSRPAYIYRVHKSCVVFSNLKIFLFPSVSIILKWPYQLFWRFSERFYGIKSNNNIINTIS